MAEDRRSRVRRPRRDGGEAGALAVGILAALVAPVPGARILPAPRTPALDLPSSPASLDAASALAAEVARGLAAVSTVALLLLGFAGGSLALIRLSRRGEVDAGLAVRAALGATRLRLVRHLWRRARPGVALALAIGGAVGVAVRWAAAVRWPADLTGFGGVLPSEVSGSAWGGGAAGAAPLLAALLVVAGGALILPLQGLAARMPARLRTGSAATDDPRAGTLRRLAVGAQVALAVALAGASLPAAGGTIGAPDGPSVPGAGPGSNASVRVQRFRSPTGPRIVSGHAGLALATTGSWLGLGRREQVVVECGACYVGVNYLPFQGVDSTIHAVSPGFFAAVGIDVVEGRPFTPGDDEDAPAVALVSARFATRHFEAGAPVGHRVRLPGTGDRWVQVVGVVEDRVTGVPGSHAPGDLVLYLPLAQHRVREVSVALAEGATAPPALPEMTPIGPPVALDEVRAAALAPGRWSRALVGCLALLALALTLGSVRTVAEVEARGRLRSAATRVALGAAPGRMAAALHARALLTTGCALVFGWTGAGAIRDALGASAPPSAPWAAGVSLVVVAATVAGTWPSGRRLQGADPAVVLRDV
jgi:hypothetical protein